jgi:ABC-type multidrug transport system ATPase subunit
LKGDVKINFKEINKDSFIRYSGYVMQEDYLSDSITVRECIELSAFLKLPNDLPTQEKLKRVDEVLNDLKISHIANNLIGGKYFFYINRSIS